MIHVVTLMFSLTIWIIMVGLLCIQFNRQLPQHHSVHLREYAVVRVHDVRTIS